MNFKKGTHEVILNRNGTTSLKHLASGEVMHSSIGPKEEATLLYVEQSRLAERPAAQPLVLFDVGLGAATNALAALQARRNLEIISFETDLTGLALAVEHRDRFPFFDGYENAVLQILETGRWESTDGNQRWRVLKGNYLENLEGLPAPDLIFFDMYSPKSCPELWTTEAFRKLRAVCKNTTLYTYSASTKVRLALLLAGFYVGYGHSTGAKYDTTVAATKLTDLEKPLDERWIERLKKSHAIEEAERENTLRSVLSQPQFSRTIVG